MQTDERFYILSILRGSRHVVDVAHPLNTDNAEEMVSAEMECIFPWLRRHLGGPSLIVAGPARSFGLATAIDLLVRAPLAWGRSVPTNGETITAREANEEIFVGDEEGVAFVDAEAAVAIQGEIATRTLRDAHGVSLKEALRLVGDEVWGQVFGRIQHRIGVDLAGELSHEIGKAHDEMHSGPAVFEIEVDEIDVMATEVLDQIRARGVVVPEVNVEW
jgi:hypothetical protein